MFKHVLATGLAVTLAAGGMTTLAASSAQAAPTNYNISMVFSDGGSAPFTVAGSFSFDPAECGTDPCPTAFSNVNITVPAIPDYGFDPITYTDADVCPEPAGSRNCRSRPESGSLGLSLAALSGSSRVFNAISIRFTPDLKSASPAVNLSESGIYVEGDPLRPESADLTKVIPPIPPAPPIVPQVPKAGSVTIPNKLPRKGLRKIASKKPKTNAAQRVTVRVRCSALRGDLRTCKLVRTNNGQFLRTFGRPVQAKIVWSAPAVPGFTAYREVKKYRS
jgi:hypothetical protein